jgi:hypothetical protein
MSLFFSGGSLSRLLFQRYTEKHIMSENIPARVPFLP